MKIYFYTIFTVIFLFFCSTTLTAGVYFEDSFENTVTNQGPDHVDPVSDAQWGSARSCEVVDSSLTSITPHTGSKILRLRWGAGDHSSTWAEQRFDLGSPQTGDVYIRYYVYYPDGTEPDENKYVHRDGPDADNNKLMRLWGAEYEDPIKVGARTMPPLGDYAEIFSFTANVSAYHVNGCSGAQGSAYLNESLLPTWNMQNSDLGRWMCFEFHYRRDTGEDNGAFEFWVDGESKISETNFVIEGAPCSPGYFMLGYLMGWANSGFDTDINIYIDDVVFSDSYIGPIHKQITTGSGTKQLDFSGSPTKQIVFY